MNTGGGTGEREEEESSSSDESDPLREGVEISIQTLPAQLSAVDYFPQTRYIPVHTIRVSTSVAIITVVVRGYPNPSTELLLLTAIEQLRSARSRLRRGTIQETPQQQ